MIPPRTTYSYHDKTWYNHRTITIAELIEKLKKFPPDLHVATEGCDCLGDAFEVVLVKGEDNDFNPDDFVVITRPTQEDVDEEYG